MNTDPAGSELGDTPEQNPCSMYLGIDVGGTNVKLGIVDAAGVLLGQTMVATAPLRTPEKVFAYAMEFAAVQLKTMDRSLSDLDGVGLAVPGVLDTRRSILREVVNLPGWQGEPLRQLLFSASQLPSIVLNDANAAAFAEHSLRDLGDRSLALVTLGTGIGCGMVINGQPFGGDHGCGGELGHIAIRFGSDALPCTCGSRGHLEAYAGSAGVISQMRQALDRTKRDQVPESFRDTDFDPRDITHAAEQGFQPAIDVIDQTARYVGQAIGMLGQVIDPAVVLLGGAMTFGGPASSIGQRFLQQVRQAVHETTLVQVRENMTIDFASLANDAGILGAALAAYQSKSP